MPAPRTTKAWRVEGTGSLDCLKFHKELALPELSDNDVLVKFHAASLNYRDLIIPISGRATILSPWRRMSSQAPTEPEKL
ncbi:hypothetical protein N0V84_004815 [Fusarium piperis]|uniref:Alcohol dehydrogenase n=1 Tax=Fusarium piperis TaxID=1435070 RepID=A0A9W8WEX3_9HYPO|nr:hypothetical protein N0V84_004815 [Fusarium piperis]